MSTLTPDDLRQLRTRSVASVAQPASDAVNAEGTAVTAEVKRIGDACHQCTVVEDSPDADDGPFIKLCPGKRRRQIRAKTAKCHIGRWVVDVRRFCGQVRQGNPVVDDGCSSLQMKYISRQGFS